MWFKIDHNLLDHAKWETLEDDPARWSRAVAVWLACGTACSRLQTDGLVRVSRVRRLTPLDASEVKAGIEDLVAAGLIDQIDGELWMHDFLVYNPSKAEQDSKRDKKSARNKRDYEAQKAKRTLSAESGIQHEFSTAESEVRQVSGSDPVGLEKCFSTPPDRTVPFRTVPDRTVPDRTVPDRVDQETAAPSGTDDTEQPRFYGSDLSNELKRARSTQGELAKFLHTGNDTVSKWCRGVGEPPNKFQIPQICNFLQIQAERILADQTEDRKYQDVVRHGFEQQFVAKFQVSPTWKAQHSTAIKRWRKSKRTPEQVLDKARIMISWHGTTWPCKKSCDFDTLVTNFDKFVEVKPTSTWDSMPETIAARHRREERESEQAQ